MLTRQRHVKDFLLEEQIQILGGGGAGGGIIFFYQGQDGAWRAREKFMLTPQKLSSWGLTNKRDAENILL
jgi:hypothetical protein